MWNPLGTCAALCSPGEDAVVWVLEGGSLVWGKATQPGGTSH